MSGPSPDDLFGETARLAFHFHWPLETILDLEHRDRQRFLEAADAIAIESMAARDEEASWTTG